MDPISTVQSAIALAMAIKLWLEAQKEREEVIQSLSATTHRICDVLAPFNDEEMIKKLDSNVISGFNGIKDALFRTKEHLIAWGGSKGPGRQLSSPKKSKISFKSMIIYFVPSFITKALRQDEQDLHNQLVGMLFILAVNNLLKETKNGGPEVNTEVTMGSDPPPYEARPISEKMVDEQIPPARQPEPEGFFNLSFHDPEVAQFWKDYVGAKVMWANKYAFRHALEGYTGKGLKDRGFSRILFTLDEYRIGGVSPTVLDRQVQEAGGMAKFLEAFQAHDYAPRRESMSGAAKDPRVPLLLWVDDNPHNNTEEMRYAETLGIHVVSVTSTVSAKEWIEANSDFLRSNDMASRVRVISDNARIEFDPSQTPASSQMTSIQTQVLAQYNFSAGESIVRYLRGHLYELPVLIYCGQSIPYTQYVEGYAMSGSTVRSSVVRKYIKALKDGKTDDEGWRGFNAIGMGAT